jgi:MraZ protein
MPTFLGRSTHSLDDKGRLILPKRILDEVAPVDRNFTLTAGPEGCLLMLDAASWRVVAQRSGTDVLGNKQQRAMRRIFLGHAEQVSPDRANRISIAEGLRQYAGLDASKEVVLVGTGQTFEIWAKEKWDAALAAALSSYEFSDNDLVGSTASSQP